MATESPLRMAVMEKPAPIPVPPRSPFSLPCPRLLPALVASAALWLCYFPMALGFLAWVALVPLLCLARAEARPRNIYWAAWVAGLAFYWPVLQWMRIADYRMYYTWGLLATYCSLYVPAAIFLIRKLDRGTSLPLMVTVPVVWAGLEFLRSFLLTGFAWYYLGHTQHAMLPVIQIADLAGVYGVTFLLAAVNAWLFEVLYAKPWFRACFKLAEVSKTGKIGNWLAVQGFIVFFVVGAALFYGFWRLDQEDFSPGPRLGLLQGNLDQRLRNEATAGKVNARLDINNHYLTLCQVAMKQSPPPDLLVWPETSFPAQWVEVSPKLAADKIPGPWAEEGAEIQKLLPLLGASLKVNHLLGINTKILDERGRRVNYNSALLVTRDGKWGPRYDKIHRVPFGEYVPLRDWIPFMNTFAPYDFDYSIREGASLTRFKLGAFHFGVLVCFEDTDPFLARQYGVADRDGPPVDFLLNISNDGWFDGSSEHEEHLAICRFRAIECRRAVARSVNMGVSAVIDSNGRVLQPVPTPDGIPDFKSWEVVERDGRVPEMSPGQWAEFKKVGGVVGATVPIDRRASLYAHLGDWLPWGCWAVIAGGIIAPYTLRRRPLAASRSA